MSKYEVLGVSRSSSFQELKKSYQAAVLASHPDKQAGTTDALRKQAEARFLLVQEAWETLQDVDLRQDYDCRLELQARNVVVSDEVKLEDMTYDDSDGGVYSYECRCGDAYIVTAAELREGFEVLDCGGCSLYIRVLKAPEDRSSTPLAAERTALCNITPRAASEKNGLEDKETSLKAVETWMDEAGVDRRGSTRLRSFAGRGIGLEACRDLERDSTVASIPLRCCFSSDPAGAPDGSLRALAHAILDGIPFEADIAAQTASPETRVALDKDVVSVTLQVLLERMAGDRSEFVPWMAMLPRKVDLNLPALWPEDDLKALEGTLVWQELKQCLAAAELERCYVEASIVSFVGREVAVDTQGNGSALLRKVITRGHETLAGRPTWSEWLHARCVVQSRAYRVGGRYLLIPLVDFANHDDDIVYAVCPGDGIFTELDEVVLTADRNYRPGQEVCASYGDAMDNAKRLFSFGFVSLSEPCSLSGEKIRLPTEAFCDVEFPVDASDPLRTFKEDVLRGFLGAEDGTSHVGAVFRLEPCQRHLRQIVDGPANSFVGSLLPLLRLAALTPHDLMRNRIADLCEAKDGCTSICVADDVNVGGGVNRGGMDGVRTWLPAVAVSALGSRERDNILMRLKCSVSQENERNALRLLSEQCVNRLHVIGLHLSDLDSLREAAHRGHESERIAVTEPRCLLVAAVRVGEAMAWHALLEAVNKRKRLDATAPKGDKTWASWISEQCKRDS